MRILRAGPRMTTDVSFLSFHYTGFYRYTVFKTCIYFLFSSLASVDPQAEKHRLPGGPGSCWVWKWCSEGKSNWCLKINIFSQKRIFWNPSFLLGNQYNGKITTGCSSDAGCSQSVDTRLFPSATEYFKRCYDASFLSEIQPSLAWHSQLWVVFQKSSVPIVTIMTRFSKDFSTLSAELLWKPTNNYLGE